MPVRVGINGFGRIGRNFFRAQQELGADIEIVALNDLGDAKTMAHLLKYDSNLGPFKGEVELGRRSHPRRRRGDEDAVRARSRPRCPGATSRVDVVLESTGIFTDRDGRAEASRRGREEGRHLGAPATDPDVTLVLGVNDDAYDPPRTTSSRTPRARRTASRRSRRCSTTSAGIESGFMTTIHAYTKDQAILDLPHKDLRRARAAAINLIPTSTGAAKAIGLVLPELQGKVDGVSVRAPVPTGSLTDLVGHARAGGQRRRGQRRLPRGSCRPARGDPAVLRANHSSRRTSTVALLVHLRQPADDGARPGREGVRLVRQRVGVQLSAGRPDDEAQLP